VSLICAVDGVIATDRRYSVIANRDGRLVGYSDHGEKLLRVDVSTWVTFAGRWKHVAPIVEQLRAARSHDDAWAVLERSAAARPLPLHTAFLIAGTKGVGRVDHAGVRPPSPEYVYVGHPPDGDNAPIAGEIRGFFAELECEAFGTTGDLVRRVARMYARVSALSEYVGETMELAAGTRYLAGSAAAIAAMDDGELLAQMRVTTSPLPLAS
jgi:hypothetical protein